ncbi:hypothetical protein [Salirhabdus salicampi]|uniref:hypothetical protein n=1 Tax=Salirhabdus salicampi TaxID=476102 RepID=UPI0020C34C28|nr:hypothetical protein [Salirhabdus salicampi]MCP8616211.1 hypothetical protein [Salirhabdus salicampi]
MVTSLIVLSLTVLTTFFVLSTVENLSSRKRKKNVTNVDQNEQPILAYGKR